jgi:release factor glutamine methyltransferase
VTRTSAGTTSVRDALDSAVVGLSAAGVDTPRLDAEVLLAHVLDVDRTALFLDPGRGLTPSHAGAFRELVRRRQGREPVSHLVGLRGFRHLELAVDARVLTPRPETEHLVEAALGLPRGVRVADVGTGSGAVALALKDERPDLEVLATDVSTDALDVAHQNAAALGLEVAFFHGDLLDALGAGVRVDAVVSNPPYVADGTRLPPEVARHEPAVALFGGPDGLEVIRRLVPQAVARGARLVALEVGAGQAGAVGALLREAGMTDVAVVPDLAGIERVVVGRC